MSRQFRRHREREERTAQAGEPQRAADRTALHTKRERTPPREYMREVRGEMRKVAWPSRQEVASYTLVVLVATAVLMAIVFGMDLVFGRVVFAVFGG